MRLGLLRSVSWDSKPMVVITGLSDPGKLPDVLWAWYFQVVDLTSITIHTHNF